MCIRHKNGGDTVEINPHRLPRTVLPESYKLKLAPDLKTGTYSGEVSIKVKVTEAANEIALNAITFEDEAHTVPNLTVTAASISNNSGTSFNGRIENEPEAERVHVHVGGQIGVGDWLVTLKFNGKLNDKMRGFYRSTYKDEAGNEKVIATTQFESTDARRAFPCFDEPDMKATFELTMEIDENLTAVSNTKPVSESIVEGSRMVLEENDGSEFLSDEVIGTGRKLVKFAPTMKMSTYILAFVVGDIVRVKTVMVDGVEVSLLCTPGNQHLTKFAMKAATFSLRYFRKYFGVRYAGDKLDLIAIPDFAAGAMENMGLAATFRDEALLVDEDNASQGALMYVAEVVAHEIAHMWFGNLVTMRWWNGLWLNEAFATFMSYKCAHAWKPSWNVWDKFGLSRAGAYRTDALKTTRPVEFKVMSPADAEGMFDVLTYEKGCSVMRMLETFMGEETFRKGIALYISTHAYGNTEGADLWAALHEASGMPVDEIMHGWIFTPGFPVVSVSATGEGSITLKQSQFKYLADGVDPAQRWQVPVQLRAKTAEGQVEVQHLLTQAEETIYLGEGLEWVVANAGGHGFYRVIYSQELVGKLTANLQQTLSVIERANLLGDQWACVQAGLEPSLEFVKLVKLFADESDPNVWAFITGPLATLRRLLPTDRRGNFEAMVRQLVGPALTRLGWEAQDGEPVQVSELRGDLIAVLALTGNDPQVKAKAHDLFAAWKGDKTSVPGDVISAVIGIVAAGGDQAIYDEFYSLFKAAATPEEEGRFRGALARFKHPDLHAKTLELCLDPKEIRSQDAPSLVAAAIGNETHAAAGWQFAKDNWEKIGSLFQSVGQQRVASAITSLNTAEFEADVQDFFARNPIKGRAKALSQYLELQRVNRLVRERETPALHAEFAQAA